MYNILYFQDIVLLKQLFFSFVIVLLVQNEPFNLISRNSSHTESNLSRDSGRFWLKWGELLVNSPCLRLSLNPSLHQCKKPHFCETMELNYPLNKMALQQQYRGTSDECESAFELVINYIAVKDQFNRKDSR